MSERRKWLHFCLWLAIGGAVFFALASLYGCAGTGWLGSAQADRDISNGTTLAQGAAAALGQPWAVPVIGAIGAGLVGLHHAVFGIPGVPAMNERVKRKRAVRQAQRDAVKAGRPTVA